MEATSQAHRPIPAKQRILDAAISLFLRKSYDETSLRDIATEAKVDVAYVHRSYGSKAEIFRQALLATSDSAQLLSVERPSVMARMADQVVHRSAARRAEPQLLDIALRSMSCVEAQTVLREVLRDHFVDPLAAKLGHQRSEQAAIITAFLAGLSIMRTVLAYETLADMDEARLREIIITTLQQIAKEHS